MTIPKQVVELIKKNPCTTVDMPCSNCGQDKPLKIRNPPLCDTCYSYQLQMGKARPAYLFTPSQRSQKPTWCKICRQGGEIINGRCNTCRGYFARHRKERPRRFWDSSFPCRNCGIPKIARRQIRGYCVNCNRYKSRFGKDRPRELWGIGPMGWCEDGWPAIVVVAGIPLCKSCAELETSR